MSHNVLLTILDSPQLLYITNGESQIREQTVQQSMTLSDVERRAIRVHSSDGCPYVCSYHVTNSDQIVYSTSCEDVFCDVSHALHLKRTQILVLYH